VVMHPTTPHQPTDDARCSKTKAVSRRGRLDPSLPSNSEREKARLWDFHRQKRATFTDVSVRKHGRCCRLNTPHCREMKWHGGETNQAIRYVYRTCTNVKETSAWRCFGGRRRRRLRVLWIHLQQLAATKKGSMSLGSVETRNAFCARVWSVLPVRFLHNIPPETGTYLRARVQAERCITSFPMELRHTERRLQPVYLTLVVGGEARRTVEACSCFLTSSRCIVPPAKSETMACTYRCPWPKCRRAPRKVTAHEICTDKVVSPFLIRDFPGTRAPMSNL
jgi:hypothetical protein